MRAVVTVIGKDRTGIIYNVSKILAENEVNIEDISQTVMHDFFTMIMLVDMKNMSVDFGVLKAALEEIGNTIGMSIRIQHEDLFNAMHTI
ncbi:MAG: ACT domain-containing protein [Acetobacterium sp.]|nr:ACT domain-containing protein [uncultured Acetobacterium sp.]MBI4855683.1 ACT domain-containing protein [Acetobacterium woodii]MBU4439193.1 ACT domain-containing protein [Bacillota bacterium]MCG2729274.1 ACT domain-containing protein [Acetobacterium sp.]